jgi:hypothetical protein
MTYGPIRRDISKKEPVTAEELLAFVRREWIDSYRQCRDVVNRLVSDINAGRFTLGDVIVEETPGAPTDDAPNGSVAFTPGGIYLRMAGVWTLVAPGTPATTVVSETAFGQVAAVGTGTKYARDDHTHGTPAAPAVPSPATTVVTEVVAGQAAAVGTAVTFAREDHTHGTPPAGGAGTFFQATADFGSPPTCPGSVTVTVADAGVGAGQKIVASVAPEASRALDEMELGPVVVAVGNIVVATSFDVLVSSVDGDATGQYTVTATR